LLVTATCCRSFIVTDHTGEVTQPGVHQLSYKNNDVHCNQKYTLPAHDLLLKKDFCDEEAVFLIHHAIVIVVATFTCAVPLILLVVQLNSTLFQTFPVPYVLLTTVHVLPLPLSSFVVVVIFFNVGFQSSNAVSCVGR
jgi:hypothetical protein